MRNCYNWKNQEMTEIREIHYLKGPTISSGRGEELVKKCTIEPGEKKTLARQHFIKKKYGRTAGKNVEDQLASEGPRWEGDI